MVKRLSKQLTERQVEERFRLLLARAEPRSKTLKLNVMFNRGWPDRLVVLPGGRVAFVEVKRARGKLRPQQVEAVRRLEALGQRVVVGSDAAELVKAVLA